MKRLEKESFVLRVKDEIKSASTVIAVNRSFGITVDQINELRSNMRKTNANLKVIKNTLAKIAIKDSHLEPLGFLLEGPTALAYSSSDPIGMAKTLVDFAKSNEKLTILGGVMDGKFIKSDTITSLASLPSMDELRSKLVGILTAAATKVVRTIKEPSARVTRVIAART
ncbi:MAG: 50S ribosomal protein L10 [Holosporales bacterium]|jgi:large subunit ribosomal protein L10|nr:50S ribosomal protein L10 [Holosporales bacterium]